MSFTSVEYVFFLIAACIVSHTLGARSRPTAILLLSCVYYATWDVRAFIPMLVAAAASYLVGLQLESTQEGRGRSIIGYGSVGVLIASLLLLKDLPPSARPLQWVTPLGVSYYTFKLVSYILDVMWRKQPAERNPVAFASYAIFFPQIVAGPIQRSEDYLSQIRKPSRFSPDLIYRASSRIAIGLIKKLLIADRLGILLNEVYRDVHTFSGAPLLIAFYLFPIQLYADFSGLTDIAIGSALLLGIESPENFNYPFAATSIGEFWRRWHMSLTNWLRDYVFTPLLMATRNWGQSGLVVSICTNLMSVALWHGIGWNFFTFGVYHSALVSGEAVTARRRNAFLKAHRSWSPWATVMGMIVTFHLLAVSMVFWRAQRVSDAISLLARLWKGPIWVAPAGSDFLTLDPWRTLLSGIAVFAFFTAASELWKRKKPFVDFTAAPRWFQWSAHAVLLVAFLTVISLMLVHGSIKQPFLYEIF